MQRRRRMPTDPSKLSRLVIDIVTGAADPEPADERDPMAVARGRKGGLIGGRSRAASISKRRIKAIAQSGAATRWGKKGK